MLWKHLLYLSNMPSRRTRTITSLEDIPAVRQPSLYQQMKLIVQESSTSNNNTRSSRENVAETVREFVRNVEGINAHTSERSGKEEASPPLVRSRSEFPTQQSGKEEMSPPPVRTPATASKQSRRQPLSPKTPNSSSLPVNLISPPLQSPLHEKPKKRTSASTPAPTPAPVLTSAPTQKAVQTRDREESSGIWLLYEKIDGNTKLLCKLRPEKRNPSRKHSCYVSGPSGNLWAHLRSWHPSAAAALDYTISHQRS